MTLSDLAETDGSSLDGVSGRGRQLHFTTIDKGVDGEILDEQDYSSAISPQLRMAHNQLAEAGCRELFNQTRQAFRNNGTAFCDTNWDSASCWPPTLAGLQAVLPCPANYGYGEQIAQFDTSFNATRVCQDNGTWTNISDYDSCSGSLLTQTLMADNYPFTGHDLAMAAYYIGYTASVVSCCVALWLFLYFRTLHCLRNTLHCNLIISYILMDVMWMIMTCFVLVDSGGASKIGDNLYSGRLECRILVAFYVYFQLTNFFWMLVEGLYIILIIFRTHKLEMLCFWPFALIGWVVPLFIVLAWVLVKIVHDNEDCWFELNISTPYNFIFIGPILFVLMVNLIFLLTIMHILLRKYRGTTTTAASTRRTAKSFLILLPLLGVTYVLFLVLPPEGTARTVLVFVTASLNSMQGFFVSLLYCFLNNEVRSIIRLRGNSFFPYRTWLKLDSSSMRRSPRTLSSSAADNQSLNGMAAVTAVQEPPALSRYRQNENLRQLHINTVTANKNELAYLLKEKEYQERIQKQIRHQALGYRSTVF